MRKVNLVACNFTHRRTDNENFFACGAGEPAAQAGILFRGGAREKKSVGFVDEGQKVPRGAEVKYIDIVLFVVLFVALISALCVQESDGIVVLFYYYNNYLQQQQQQQHVTDSRWRLSDIRNGADCGQFSLTGLTASYLFLK